MGRSPDVGSNRFNPRPPCGERRLRRTFHDSSTVFQSTPPVRGATAAAVTTTRRYRGFNPRPPCGERRSSPSTWRQRLWFQSTPPVRGATLDGAVRALARPVSIHAPRAGSDIGWWNLEWAFVVSIHAPRAGSDRSPDHRQGGQVVSIHAPRAGSDPLAGSEKGLQATFQSTPPVRGATTCFDPLASGAGFQSTPPVRGATHMGGRGRRVQIVSIHAPRAGSDYVARRSRNDVDRFNPRPPCGERRPAGQHG